MRPLGVNICCAETQRGIFSLDYRMPSPARDSIDLGKLKKALAGATNLGESIA
jgi:hypothetical protein